ncbi:MAG: DUF4890 domain-containing protein [Dysgonamonadaceae bacterium]|nr:DUF4890 domain-containing protein [Dysgonamonadaceae bacterium]
MKKLIFAAFILSISAVTFAQPPGGGQFSPEDMAKRQTEWMKTELKLTDAQIAPVDSINLVYAKKQGELFQQGGGGGDREAMREKMTALNAEKEKAFAAVLTEEQLKKYKENPRAGFGGGRRGGQGGPGGERPQR